MGKFEEWNTKLLSLTPEEFEELSYELIDAQGFTNLRWFRGGGDRGKDITAEMVEKKPGFTTITTKWCFQCKRYKTGIPVKELTQALEWVVAEGFEYFVVISNSQLTPDCKDFVKKKETQGKLKIFEWTDKKFQKILFRFPHIVEIFFPKEKIPETEKITKPQKLFEISFNVPQDIHQELKVEIGKLESLGDEEKTKRTVNLINEKVIASPYIDDNIKGLIFQQLSIISFNNDDFSEALKYLEEALSITPKNRNVLMNKGFVLIKIKNYNEAIKCFDKVLKVNSEDKFALNNKGLCLKKLYRDKGAMIYFKKAAEIDPSFISARDNIGLLLEKRHRFDEAIKVYDETLLKYPKSKTTLNAKALALMELKDYREAYKIINEVIEIDPYFVVALNNKGAILQRNGKSQSSEKYNKLALETFERVIELDPNYVVGYTNKSACLALLDQFEEALEFSSKTLDIFPKEEIAWSRRSYILRYNKKYDEALRSIDNALQIRPNHKDSLINQGIVFIQKGKFKKALKISKKLNKLFPVEIDGWLIRGDSYGGLGKKGKAEKSYKKANALDIPVKSLIE